MATSHLTNESPNNKRFTHGQTNSPEYNCFHHAKKRCQSPKNSCYRHYGGRGIEFRFTSFEEFFAEVGKRPSPSHSIERINNNGHYEKGNVRWATKEEQGKNKRNNVNITIENETKTMSEWCAIRSIPTARVHLRIKNGWCGACAVIVPKTTRGSKKKPHCPHK